MKYFLDENIEGSEFVDVVVEGILISTLLLSSFSCDAAAKNGK